MSVTSLSSVVNKVPRRRILTTCGGTCCTQEHKHVDLVLLAFVRCMVIFMVLVMLMVLVIARSWSCSWPWSRLSGWMPMDHDVNHDQYPPPPGFKKSHVAPRVSNFLICWGIIRVSKCFLGVCRGLEVSGSRVLVFSRFLVLEFSSFKFSSFAKKFQSWIISIDNRNDGWSRWEW